MQRWDEVKLNHVFESFKQWWIAGKRDVAAELARLKSAAKLFESWVVPERS